MPDQAQCTFKITGWDEKPYKEFEDGAKLTRAQISQTYEGDLVGESTVEFLMSHAADKTAHFIGFEHVTGSLAGKTGSFIIQHVGTYGSTGAQSNWKILPDSGTDALIGITGQGSYTATSETVSMPFSYTLHGES